MRIPNKSILLMVLGWSLAMYPNQPLTEEVKQKILRQLQTEIDAVSVKILPSLEIDLSEPTVHGLFERIESLENELAKRLELQDQAEEHDQNKYPLLSEWVRTTIKEYQDNLSDIKACLQ